MSENDSHWTAKARWMRDNRASDAAWSTEGHLVHCALLPEIPAATDDPAETQETPQARAKHEREERRRVAHGASGGPVRRLSEGD